MLKFKIYLLQHLYHNMQKQNIPNPYKPIAALFESCC